MTKAVNPGAINDELTVPEFGTAADLLCRGNNIMENQVCLNNCNGKLQKSGSKRSRKAAADASTTKSSSCSRPKLSPANGINKVGSASRNSSKYRGVTRHRWTGRYEAHLWDKNSWNQSQSKKGRQVYLGAYDNEETAAHAYDLAALKYWGSSTILNFPVEMYNKEIEDMRGQTREEYIASLRRKSNGFSRGVSKYRGVARHHHNGRWEARIGRVYGNKYLYLGTYSTQEEAAMAYDIAALQYRGLNAVTNFDMSNYLRCLPPGHSLLAPSHPSPSALQDTDNTDSSTNTAASSSATTNHKGQLLGPKAAASSSPINQHSFLPPYLFQPCPRLPILRFCARASYAAGRLDHQLTKDDNDNNMLIMQLENILGTSNDHLNVIQDQVSATCSAPPPCAEYYLQQPSANAGGSVANYHVNDFLPQLTTPAPKPAATAAAADANYDPTHLNTTYHLEKLMAEYKELLQSPNPKDILEKGTLSVILDTLSDTASSATTGSLPSTIQATRNTGFVLNQTIIKPGGYVAGLLSSEEECIKYVDPTLDGFNIVPGTTDSICSSNDLSTSLQEFATSSKLPDINCNINALINPFHVNYISSDGLILDTGLSSSNVAPLMLPTTFNMLHHHYLQS